MKSFAAVAILVAAATAAHLPEPVASSNGTLVTSVVYTTQEITITSCPPEVTVCPEHSTVVSTITIPAYTTICPASEVQPKPTSPAAPIPPSSGPAPVYSTSAIPPVSLPSPIISTSGSAAPTYVASLPVVSSSPGVPVVSSPGVPVITATACPGCPTTLGVSSSAAAVPQQSSGAPIVPGSSLSFSAPGSAITVGPTASVYPTGVTPTGVSPSGSAAPIFTGAAYKVGGSMVGAVAMVGAALML